MRASLSRTLLLATAWAATTQLAAAQYARGVNVTGAEWGNKTLPGANGSQYLYPSQQTFEYFAARGFNFIRLTNLWERLQPKLSGPLDPTVLGYLKANIASAKAAGIKVSVEIHNFGRYTIPSSACTNQDPWGTMPNACIIDNMYNGQKLVTTADLADFWVKMSNEFKDDDTVLAYDLMNEPHDMGTANWMQITQDVLTAIRGNNDNKLIMIPGDGGSSAPFWPNNHGPTQLDQRSGQQFLVPGARVLRLRLQRDLQFHEQQHPRDLPEFVRPESGAERGSDQCRRDPTCSRF